MLREATHIGSNTTYLSQHTLCIITPTWIPFMNGQNGELGIQLYPYIHAVYGGAYMTPPLYYITDTDVNS